jgi:hypothetical protein
MSDELVLHGKTYLSSRKAAEQTGYARDYIGQLSRGGLIEAERVGGLWYVSLESLQKYENNGDSAKAISATALGKEAESSLVFEGKDYVSASRAAKLSGYNQDYVGQLARGGKIPSRQIGNRWYVDRDALLAHKKEKDALLAAVQSEALGLKASKTIDIDRAADRHTPIHDIRYVSDNRDLLPIPAKKEVSLVSEQPIPAIVTPQREIIVQKPPIQVKMPHYEAPRVARPKHSAKRKVFIGSSVGILTIILVLSVGLFTIEGNPTIMKVRDNVASSAMTAATLDAANRVGDVIEDVVSPLIRYERAERWQ